MKIERIDMRLVRMRLKSPFQTSFATEWNRDCVILSVHADGLTGWGECVASSVSDDVSNRNFHLYSYETTTTAWHALKDFLIPQLIDQPMSVMRVVEIGEQLRGHGMARAALEAALWDLTAQIEGIPLARALGGARDRVPVGVSIGIQPSIDEMLKRVDEFLAQGYRRVKLKIQPGSDMDVVKRVRETHPDLLLQVDANSAYTLGDAPVFEAMDDLRLLMIEQPLGWDDIYEHSKLQARLHTPICLDESIHSLGDVLLAIEMKAMKVINIKPARVSGFTEARRIHDVCRAHGIPVWCGGMLETGIGRAGNLAVASMPGFTLPGDISASDRYFVEEFIDAPFALNPDSTIDVPSGVGLGVQVDLKRLDALTVRREAFGV